MSEEFEKYADSKENFDKTREKLRKTINLLKESANALKNIEKVTISNCAVGSSSNLGGPSIDANEWPTAESMGILIDDYHKYKIDMQNTYARLSDREKDNIKLPAFLGL